MDSGLINVYFTKPQVEFLMIAVEKEIMDLQDRFELFHGYPTHRYKLQSEIDSYHTVLDTLRLEYESKD